MMRKCMNCGSNIRIRNGVKGVCEYCGTIVDLSDFLDEYGRKMHIIDTYMKFKDYKKACDLVDELCRIYPDRVFSWSKRAAVYYESYEPNEQLIKDLEDSLAKAIVLDESIDETKNIQNLLDTVREKFKKRIEIKEAEREAELKKAHIKEEEERKNKQQDEEMKKREEKEYNLKKAGTMFALSILLFIFGAGNCMFLILWPASFITLGVSVKSLCEAYDIIL